ncbi:MAG: tetratricopeptide repeat protein [Dehalogenimonas sp.]
MDGDIKGKRPKTSYLFKSINSNSKHESGNPTFIGIQVPIPNSTTILPAPLWLGQKELEEVLSLEKSFFTDNKIQPGRYREWNDIKDILFPLHDSLIESLEKRINEINGRSLLIQLYDQLEIMYGTLAKHRVEGLAATALTSDQRIPVAVDIEWRVRSSQLLGLRYLIELSVKGRKNSDRLISPQMLLGLMALSTRVSEMDTFLDHVSFNAIPHELIITDALVAQLRMTEETFRTMKLWQRARKKRLFEGSLEQLAGLQMTTSQDVQEYQLTEDPVWIKLNKALEVERGYSLTDWLHLFRAVIMSFNDYERLKSIPKVELIHNINNATGLDCSVISKFLDDFILSESKMIDLSRDKMLPSENFWRDLRITNRPLIEINEGKDSMLIYGVETTQFSLQTWFHLLIEGRSQVAHCQNNGPLARALGSIREKSGNIFRDEVLNKCKQTGLEAVPEKSSVNGNKLPQGIGPIDILTFDRRRSTFILIECKDVSVRITPKELKRQREEFIGKSDGDTNCILGELRKKEKWFKDHLPALRQEYGILPDQDVSLTGVVVVSHPMMWIFPLSIPIPILDEDEFYEKLRTGDALIHGNMPIETETVAKYFRVNTNMPSRNLENSEESLSIQIEGDLDVLFDAGLKLMENGRQSEAVELFHQCLRVSQDPRAIVTLLKCIGECTLSLYRIREAEKALVLAESKAKELNDNESLSAIYANLANIYQIRGELDKALDRSEKSLSLLRELGNTSSEAAILGNMGIIHRLKGQPDKAMEKLSLSLELCQKIGNKKGEGNALSNIGNVFQTKADLNKALEYYGIALKIHEELGNREGEANNLGSIGLVYANQGLLDKAMYYLQLALMVHREIGNIEGEAISLKNIGNVYELEGDLERAIEYRNLCLKSSREIGNLSNEVDALTGLGVLFVNNNQINDALECYKSLKKVFTQIGDVRRSKSTGKIISRLQNSLKQKHSSPK